MSRRISLYPAPDRRTVWVRTVKQAVAVIRSWPLGYETYGMMHQGRRVGNFGVTAQGILIGWRWRKGMGDYTHKRTAT